MARKPQNQESSATRRKAVALDVKAYLDAGKKIQKIKPGVSGLDPQGRKHIVLGNAKKTAATNKR